MTRQSRARWLAFATAALVVLLAALFAWLRNVPPSAPSPAPTTSASGVDVGRAAFERAGCMVCHAAEGRGNASLPLDGVGARLDRPALRDAAFGTAARLPAAVAEIKRVRAGSVDAEAVLDYLQQLR